MLRYKFLTPLLSVVVSGAAVGQQTQTVTFGYTGQPLEPLSTA